MLDSINLPFAEFLPDQPDFNNPGSPNINNAVPEAVGYTQLKGLSAVTTSALGSSCLGAFACKDDSSVTYNFAGTATKLYRQDTVTMTDITNVGGDYTNGADDYWEFALWGNKIIATNFADAPQILTLGGTNFADLSGSPPKAKHVATVREFVVFGNLDESATLIPNKIRWSAIGDETDWAASASTQSDSQILYPSSMYGGGQIQKIIGGEYGVILMENSCFRMTYIGTPAIFQFDEIRTIGTPARNSVTRVAENIFFLGQDGFYLCSNGSEIIPIGKEKVDRTFYEDVNEVYLDQVIAAADPTRKLIYWIYPSGASATPNRILIYNYAVEKWSVGDIAADWIYSALGTGYTLEALDNISASIDDLPASLDSREYIGGALQVGFFNTSHQKATLNGAALTATLETADYQAFTGRRGFISGIRALVEGSGSAITCQVGHKNKLQSSLTYTSEQTPNSETDITPFRVDSRYARGKIKIEGGFTHAIGMDVFATQSGHR